MGRPTKFSEETCKLILQGVLNGLSKEEAARFAGIHYDTFRRWEIKADRERSGLWHDFFEDVKKARAQLHADCLASIHKARRGGDKVEEVREVMKHGEVVERTTIRRVLGPQWQAAAWILERDCPERWARRTRVEADNQVAEHITEKSPQEMTTAELIAYVREDVAREQRKMKAWMKSKASDAEDAQSLPPVTIIMPGARPSVNVDGETSK